MYDVRFLPAARQDMVDIARYIAVELKAADAARAPIEAFSAAVERLAEFPYACRLFLPPRPLKREYRAMPVKNYMLFYWIEEEKKSITVARVLYCGRDTHSILW